MSQNTDNLALTKQDANENFSRSILNANWDKVDAFAGELRNTSTGGHASLSALADMLDSMLSSMPTNGVNSFTMNFTAVDAPFTQATYFGTLYKVSTNLTYSSAVFRRVDQPVVIEGARNTNGWSFQQLALNSQIGAGTEVVENILSTIAATYTNIQTSDARIVYVKHGIFHSLQLKFKTSAAITSGSVSLPSSVTGSLSEVEGALSSLDGYGGTVQVVGSTLYIRCGASNTNFLFGQVNWIR